MIPQEYNFYYWGPLLFKIKITPQDLKKCAKLCSKESSDVKDTLAGVIEHQHYISPMAYCKILESYLDTFRHGHKQWYGKPLTQNMVMTTSWVNFMVAGEFNPPHIHTKCDFSSVLFVKISEELKEEHKKFINDHATYLGEGPGAITFNYGETQPHSLHTKNFFPEEGDLFIFPATLTHFVAPFVSKGERISMGANFELT